MVLGLSSAGQGAANLLREGERSQNFPSADLWPCVERIARTTGANPVPDHQAKGGIRFSADKFALGGFTSQKSEKIGVPRIAECPLQFEARLLASHRSGKAQGAERSYHLMIIEVEVQQVHAHRSIVMAETSHIDTKHWNPLFYVFRHYFGDAVDLGSNFRAES